MTLKVISAVQNSDVAFGCYCNFHCIVDTLLSAYNTEELMKIRLVTCTVHVLISLKQDETVILSQWTTNRK